MRKVKHFAGYGTVMMGKVNDGTARLHVLVEGNHECGLNVGEWDEYLLFRWIVSRYEKDISYEQWHKLRPLVQVREGFKEDPKRGYIDTCDYWFSY